MHKALSLIAATVAATSVYAEKIKLEQTPPAVQQAIRAKAAGAEIEDIDREVRNDQTTYEASFKYGGTQQELLVSEAGTILRDVVGAAPTASASAGAAAGPVTLSNRSTIQMAGAPPAVQKAFRNKFPASSLKSPHQIETISKGTWNGQTIYEAASMKDGQPQVFQVTEAGKPLVANAANTSVAFQPKYAGLAQGNVPLTGGSKIQLSAAPKAVQRTIRQVSGGAPVEDIERAFWNGRTVYEAAYKHAGQHVELQVLEDGSLLTSGPSVGVAPATPASATTAANFLPRYAGLSPNNVQISGGSKIPVLGAPDAVRQTINQFAAGAPIEDMERGLWNGRTVYEAAFKKNGQHMELQVLEDGSILTHAPVGAAAGAPPVGTFNTGQQ